MALPLSKNIVRETTMRTPLMASLHSETELHAQWAFVTKAHCACNSVSLCRDAINGVRIVVSRTIFFERGSAMDISDATEYYQRGLTNYFLHEYRCALKDFSIALSLNPE